MRRLRVTTGPAAGTVVDVGSDVVVGREDADLTIADPQISRRHAVVRPVEGGVEIEDLESLNGTFVDGNRLDGRVTLTSPATIRVGDSSIAVELELEPEPEREDSTATRLAARPALPPTKAPRGVVRRIEPEAADVAAADPQPAVAAPRPEPAPASPPVGTLVIRLDVDGDLTPGATVPVTGSLVVTFEGGRIDASLNGSATASPTDRPPAIEGS